MQTSPSDTYLTPYKAEITLKKIAIITNCCESWRKVVTRCPWSWVAGLSLLKKTSISRKKYPGKHREVYVSILWFNNSNGRKVNVILLRCFFSSPSSLLSVSTFSQHLPLLSSPLLSLFPSLALLSGQVFSSIPKRSHTICLHPEFPFRSSEAPPCP